jgi:hypothetical protein
MENTKNEVETCTNCDAPATDSHLSVSGKWFPKCAKHMKEVLDAEARYASIKPFTGQNDAGEYYDEDSY